MVNMLIGEHFLNNDKIGNYASAAPVTPLQAAMIMMGCYGYPLKNNHRHDLPLIFQSADLDMARNDATLQSFYMNFLSHAYEDLHLVSSQTDYTGHADFTKMTIDDLLGSQTDKTDKSSCDCLKAFASPSLFLHTEA